jgi:hypothetical protein
VALTVRFHEIGGPEVLRLEDLPVPEPGPGEVLVRVIWPAADHAAADVLDFRLVQVRSQPGRVGAPVEHDREDVPAAQRLQQHVAADAPVAAAPRRSQP